MREIARIGVAHPRHQFGRRDRRDPFAEQSFAAQAGPFATPVTQPGIHRLALEIHQRRTRLQAEFQLRMRGHQPRQPRHQPARHDAGTGAERERIVVARAIRRQRVVDAVEMFADRLQQTAAFDGQRHAARTALEQAPFQPLFQLAHLVAERADGEIRLRRRA